MSQPPEALRAIPLLSNCCAIREGRRSQRPQAKRRLDDLAALARLPLAVLQGFHPSIEKDVYEALSLRGSLNARNTLGGTAPAQVRAQLARHRARLG